MFETATKSVRPTTRVCGRLAVTAICVLLGADAPGCKKEKPESTKVIPYPAQLSASSTPRQVAEALITALDEGDSETLFGVVAAKEASAAIDRIYAKHGKKRKGKFGGAVAATVWGWKSTYGFFEKGSVQVSEEDVEGGAATVRAVGKNKASGEMRGLVINLTREDGVWKVKPGLRSE